MDLVFSHLKILMININSEFFGEDYLKYKHLLEENKILRLRIAIKEGWVNRETGRAGDPRIQFLNMELLDGIIGLKF